ncbi:ABC transporter substrate-binding protein [Marinivivus vitaminiproducens]|uniref:ABC transporter substrate-binding protein n=1 Tax=Marinivivus vitaminiproducens TaxID=3035935 RepID=UPI0027A79AC4|nr:ABC transporter substrate-binding protein [Geminicoccaceae bacterium SCSIO 64248]
MKSKLLGAGLCLMLGAALPFVAADRAWSQDALKEVTLVIPNPSAINIFPVWVAIEEGYFEEEGLKVSVEAVDGSSQVLQAMTAGQADIGEPGPGPVLGARSRGVDVVFIYNLNPKSSFGIVVPTDSDYQSPADLKGKVIGVGTADGAEVAFARAILTSLDMTEGEDFTFLPVGDGGLATAAFLRGDIEAYAAATSDAAILTYRGQEVRDITPAEFQSYFGNGFAVLREYMDANPDVVEAFGKGLVRGTVFALDPANKEKTLEYAAIGNPQEGEDPEFASVMFDAVAERKLPVDSSLPWGYMPPEHWEAWHKSLQAAGALKEPLPDLTAAYTNDYIETWNEDVTR